MFDLLKYMPLINELVSLIKDLIKSNNEVKASNDKLCCLLDEKSIQAQNTFNQEHKHD